MPNPEWKFVVIELPVTFLSFGCLYLGIFGFKSEQNICWISEYLIYGDPVVCLFSVFSQIDIFSTLFSFYRPSKNRTKLALNLDSWKTIYLKIIALFFVVLYMYNFHLSLAAQHCFVGQWKHFSISSFWIGFTWVFRLYFPVFS